MKNIVISLVMAATLTGAAWAQDSTLPSASMPSDAAPSMNAGATANGAFDSDTMRRTNAPGRAETPPGAWQRSTNAPAWKSTGRSGSTLDNQSGSSSMDASPDTRVNTKAGTQAEPIRGQDTPSGSLPTPGGSSSTLPPASSPNF
jgi:hypothetical protein